MTLPSVQQYYEAHRHIIDNPEGDGRWKNEGDRASIGKVFGGYRKAQELAETHPDQFNKFELPTLRRRIEAENFWTVYREFEAWLVEHAPTAVEFGDFICFDDPDAAFYFKMVWY